MLLLGVNHAQSLREAGLSKRDIQEYIWKFARVPAGNLAKSFVETERGAGRGDANTIWRVRSPEDVFVAVAGGAGPQDLYIAAGAPKTRLIRTP